MKISVVSTLYRSEAYVREFCARAGAAAAQLAGDDYEIVLVNDGSDDRSLQLAVEVQRCDPHVVIVDLSRNFGHHKAMMTGLAHAGGERVFLIDCDLEEDPNWLIDFAGQLEAQSCDVVFGVQLRRKGASAERLSGALFYRIFRMATRLNLPKNPVVARLMSRRYVDALLLHREREVFMAGLWLITGFKQMSRPVVKGSRGRTTYTLAKKLAQFVNSVTSFSNLPLAGIFYVGILISAFAASWTCYLVINRLFFSKPIGGWTSVMVSIWMLGGIIISFLGVVGIYLSKVFSEVKQRPYAIVREVIRPTGGGR